MPSAREDADEHVDHLGVHARPGVAVDLGARLPKLPVAPALRLLGAKHRAEVVKAAHRLLGVERVPDVSARATPAVPSGRSAMRLVTALEREHLLFDDFGRLADRAHEEVERLEERRPDLGVARARARAADGLERVPAPDFVGQDVVHALDGPESHGSGVVAYRRGGGSGQAHGRRKASKCAFAC